jgi:ADP-ribose pyrophosphatase YjhB (NUDIX family)
MSMIDFTIGGSRFFYRAAAVAIQDGYVLLHRIDQNEYWTLPGGRVEFGETSSEALIREMGEELGQEIHVDRLLWIVESFLEDAGKPLHAVGHYYAISFPPPSRFHLDRQPFTTQDGPSALSFAWHALDALDTLEVYPPFLRQRLRALPTSPEHVLDVRT